jgi:hypothetical protein
MPPSIWLSILSGLYQSRKSASRVVIARACRLVCQISHAARLFSPKPIIIRCGITSPTTKRDKAASTQQLHPLPRSPQCNPPIASGTAESLIPATRRPHAALRSRQFVVTEKKRKEKPREAQASAARQKVWLCWGCRMDGDRVTHLLVRRAGWACLLHLFATCEKAAWAARDEVAAALHGGRIWPSRVYACPDANPSFCIFTAHPQPQQRPRSPRTSGIALPR